MKLIVRYKGGSGSGNFGHKGVPGHYGGSASTRTGNTKPDAEAAVKPVEEKPKKARSTINSEHHAYVRASNKYTQAKRKLRAAQCTYDEEVRSRGVSTSTRHALESAKDDFKKAEAEMKKYDNVLKGGDGSGNWGHVGRPGKVGGSAGGGGHATIGAKAGMSLEDIRKLSSEFRNKRKNTIPAPPPEQSAPQPFQSAGFQDNVDGIKYKTLRNNRGRSRGYFIMPDNTLLDITDEMGGGGTDDHVGYMAAAGNAEKLGIKKDVVDKFNAVDKQLGDFNGDWDSPAFERLQAKWDKAYANLWGAIGKAGLIRVREFDITDARGPRFHVISVQHIAAGAHSASSDVNKTGTRAIRQMQRWIDDGKLPMDTSAKYGVEIDAYDGRTSASANDMSYQDLMSAHYWGDVI
jgi:hypothetical protein